MASFQLANHPSFSSGVSLGPCGSRLLHCLPPPGPHCPARPRPHLAPPQPHTPHASCPGPPVSLPGGLPQCFCSWLALPPPPGSLPGSRSAHPPTGPRRAMSPRPGPPAAPRAGGTEPEATLPAQRRAGLGVPGQSWDASGATPFSRPETEARMGSNSPGTTAEGPDKNPRLWAPGRGLGPAVTWALRRPAGLGSTPLS